MPVRFRIYPAARLVHSIASGVLWGREMLLYARAVGADPAFAPDFSQLTDFRTATAFNATGQEMRDFVHMNPFARTARRVALVGSDVMYGMLRMYQIMAEREDADALVTRSEDEAWEFLGITPGALDERSSAGWASDASG